MVTEFVVVPFRLTNGSHDKPKNILIASEEEYIKYDSSILDMEYG